MKCCMEKTQMKTQNKTPQYLIDSNVWIGLYKTNDTLHERAVEQMKTIEQAPCRLFISNFIIQEVFTLLTYHANREKALEFFHEMNKSKHIFILDFNKSLLNEMVHFMENTKMPKKISFTDVSILFMSRLFGASIITFDKELEKAAKQLAHN